MRNALVVLCMIGLSSCVSPEQDVTRAAAICKAAGHSESGPGYEGCMLRSAERIREHRQYTGGAIAAGLQSYGRSMSSPPPYRAPVTCNSYRAGVNVTTRCY